MVLVRHHPPLATCSMTASQGGCGDAGRCRTDIVSGPSPPSSGPFVEAHPPRVWCHSFFRFSLTWLAPPVRGPALRLSLRAAALRMCASSLASLGGMWAATDS